jgi:hypothetical protein
MRETEVVQRLLLSPLLFRTARPARSQSLPFRLARWHFPTTPSAHGDSTCSVPGPPTPRLTAQDHSRYHVRCCVACYNSALLSAKMKRRNNSTCNTVKVTGAKTPETANINNIKNISPTNPPTTRQKKKTCLSLSSHAHPPTSLALAVARPPHLACPRPRPSHAVAVTLTLSPLPCGRRRASSLALSSSLARRHLRFADDGEGVQ